MGTSSVAEEESATENGELNGNPNGNVPVDEGEAEITIAERFSHQIDALISKANELEQRVNEVSKLYSNKRQSNASRGTIRGRKEEVCTNRMQKVMQEFGKIFEQLSRHEWAWPFMQPVDVVGLGLDDYYEETRQKEDEAQAMANMQIAQETTIAKLARDTNNELNKLNLHVAELRELVIQRCRKITTEEKRKICAGIAALSRDHLVKVMDIVAQGNPDFQVTEEVELDMDAQSDIAQWRLKFFVMAALAKNAEESKVHEMKKISDSNADDMSKRKRVIYEALTKTARKRNKKLSS